MRGQATCSHARPSVDFSAIRGIRVLANAATPTIESELNCGGGCCTTGNMYKIIGGDKNEYGPVSIEEMGRWISQNRVNAKTMVKKEGSDEWKPLGNHPELAALLGGKSPPVFAGESGAADVTALQESLAQRTVKVEIGSCISRAWKLCTENVMMLAGGVFLVGMASFIAGFIAGLIPFFGFVVNTLLNGVFSGGLFFFGLKFVRGQPVEIGDAFAGFTRGFTQLMLGSVVTSLFVWIPAAIVAIPFCIPMVSQMISGVDPQTALSGSLVLVVVGGILGTIVAVVSSILWIFVFPLIIDKQIGFWDAMQLSRKAVLRAPFAFFGLLILVGLVAASGVIACCIGLLFTMPVALLTMTFAYEDNFGNQTSQNPG